MTRAEAEAEAIAVKYFASPIMIDKAADAIMEAVGIAREECAALCESLFNRAATADECAAAIRDRSQS